MAGKAIAPGPGAECQREGRTARGKRPAIPPGPPHVIIAPELDPELVLVRDWLVAKPLKALLTDAIMDSINSVLEGHITGRFYLRDEEVDSDERSSVGTKAQYRILNALDLPKQKPLDTVIVGVAVDIKTTVNETWMIPVEAQCEICILVQIDVVRDRFRAFVMRTHRLWLNAGNQDKKRSLMADARDRFALPLLDSVWAPLPRNPLRDLDQAQREEVFHPKRGQVTRLTALFGHLPDVVIPRQAILTVCANNDDPLRRVRQAKPRILDEHGLVLLSGTWKPEREAALSAGYDLASSDWVAVRPERIAPELLPSATQPSSPTRSP